jgi:hypothetical protein
MGGHGYQLARQATQSQRRTRACSPRARGHDAGTDAHLYRNGAAGFELLAGPFEDRRIARVKAHHPIAGERGSTISFSINCWFFDHLSRSQSTVPFKNPRPQVG